MTRLTVALSLATIVGVCIAVAGANSNASPDSMKPSNSVVWLLQEFSVAPPALRYTANWVSTDADVDPIDGPGWNSLDDAIAWATARAPRVLLRLRVGPGPEDLVSFAVGEPTTDGAKRWHRTVPASRERIAGYSGLAVVTEVESEIVPLESYRIVVEYRDPEGTNRDSIASGLPLEAALERARNESRVVVVGVGLVGNYHYLDAGLDPYVPERLPRFPDPS
jgi:hypothetical protein